MSDGDTVTGVSEGQALDALRAWLLAEDSYRRGGVADEVLTYLQDHVGHLLGPRALAVAEQLVRRRLGNDGDLSELARNRAALLELLVLVQGRQDRRPELEWRAERPPGSAGATGRPTALLVMAEYGVGDPVWDRPTGTGEPVSLDELPVSRSLVERLRAWNATFERLALTDFEWKSREAHAAWVRQGLGLAHELQLELPDLEVRYFHADDDRPLRAR